MDDLQDEEGDVYMEDEEGDVHMEDDDEQDVVNSSYNPAYDNIANTNPVRAGPYFALHNNNVTAQSGFYEHNGVVEPEILQKGPAQEGQIFYDPDTSEEEEMQEIMSREGKFDSSFSEGQDATSEAVSQDSGSSESDSDDLQGEGRRGPRPRGRPPRSAAGRGGRRRGWKWAVRGTEHDPARDRAPRARASQRGRKQRVKRGPRPVLPTEEFQHTMSRANQAYLAGDLEEALELAREAVQHNPEVYSAHNLLSQVLDDMGRHEDALGALLAGAVASRDVQVWYNVAQRTTEAGGDDRSAVLHQLLYCYSNILGIDQKEYKARLARAKVYLELGRERSVKKDCDIILKHRPHEPEAIRMLARLNLTPEETTRAWQLFDETFERQMEGRTGDRARLDWSDLILYIDLLFRDEEYAKACSRLSRVSRWFLGRRAENFWDEIVEDDREWDEEDAPRRLQTPNFTPGLYQKSSYGAGLPLTLRVKLGIARLEMGVQNHDEAVRHFERLEPNNRSPNAPIFLHENLFLDVARSLKYNMRFKEAFEFYDALHRTRRRLDSEIYAALAECSREIGRNTQSREYLRAFVEMNEEHIDARVTLAKMCEEDGEVDEASGLVAEVIRLGRMDAVKRAKLRSLRAAKRRQPGATKPQNVPSTAAALKANEQSPAVSDDEEVPTPKRSKQASASTQRRQASTSRLSELASASKTNEKPSTTRASEHTTITKQSKKDSQSYNDEIQKIHQRMVTLEDSDGLPQRDTLEEWLGLAEVMTEDFRAVKSFFSGHRRFQEDQNMATASAISEMKSLAARISNRSSDKTGLAVDANEGLPDDYCGISWEDWRGIFCQYALELAKLGEAEACYAILAAAVDSVIFNKTDEHLREIHFIWLHCGLHLDDEQTVCNVARWFCKRYPYTDDVYNLYGRANNSLRCEPSWYHSGPAQKFFLRQIKAMDYALLDPEAREKYGFTEAEKKAFTDPETNDNPHGLTEPNPVLLALYGHLLATSGSHANALTYYFRAYTLRPQDAILNLSIATSYIQLAMKRQSDNRQFQVLQGLAFIGKYYDLMTADDVAIDVQAAEFNKALVWHLLNLNHLAIPGFQKCLDLSKRVQEEGGGKEDTVDFAHEAAYNLRNIFAMSGNMNAARAIQEEWMVI